MPVAPFLMLVRALTPEDAWWFQSLRLSALTLSPASFASTYEDEKNRSLDDVAARIAHTENQAVFGAFVEDRLAGIVGVRRDPFRSSGTRRACGACMSRRAIVAWA